MKQILIILVCILMFSCTKSKENSIKSTIKLETNKEKYSKFIDTQSGVNFEVKKIEIKKNDIEIELEYKGGKNIHNFTLLREDENSSQFIMIHDDKGDKLETLINERVTIPISFFNGGVNIERGIQLYNSYNNEIYSVSNTESDYYGSLITVIKDENLVKKIKEHKISTDDYKIGEYTIDQNNKILLPLLYSGGVKRHSFKLVWLGKVEDHKINVYILHNANNDNAEAYLTEILPIDKSLFGEVGKSVNFNFINISNLKSGS